MSLKQLMAACFQVQRKFKPRDGETGSDDIIDPCLKSLSMDMEVDELSFYQLQPKVELIQVVYLFNQYMAKKIFYSSFISEGFLDYNHFI